MTKKLQGKTVEIPKVAQIRIYKRLVPEIKVLAAEKGWSITETASVLISESLAVRKFNQKKVHDIIKNNISKKAR